MNQKFNFVLGRVENTGKRRKCWLPAFSPFPQCFQNASFPGSLKSGLCGKGLSPFLESMGQIFCGVYLNQLVYLSVFLPICLSVGRSICIQNIGDFVLQIRPTVSLLIYLIFVDTIIMF